MEATYSFDRIEPLARPTVVASMIHHPLMQTKFHAFPEFPENLDTH